jgi:hypothetical protein
MLYGTARITAIDPQGRDFASALEAFRLIRGR